MYVNQYTVYTGYTANKAILHVKPILHVDLKLIYTASLATKARLRVQVCLLVTLGQPRTRHTHFSMSFGSKFYRKSHTFGTKPILHVEYFSIASR